MSFKILSLDGGGSWALIQARVFLDMYDDIRGHELLKKFDMVIANSGGSLVLACLCNNMKLSEIIGIFINEEERLLIFSKLTFIEKLQWHNILSFFSRKLGARYSTKRKKEGLIKLLKSYAKKAGGASVAFEPLHELPKIIGKENLQIIIVGHDYYRQRVNFFRSNLDSKTNRFSGTHFSLKLIDAIHASSNAPVKYFDLPAHIHLTDYINKTRRRSKYWDGAVSGFNNPVLAAVVEAITNLEAGNKDISILSIGTGTGSKAILADYEYSTVQGEHDIYRKNRNNPLAITDVTVGFVHDLEKLAVSILEDPPDSASFIAYSILFPDLNPNGNLIRINPCLSPVKNASNVYEPPEVYKNIPDGKSKLLQLLNMDMDVIKQKDIELINEMCDLFLITSEQPALPNQLIRGDAGNLNPGAYLGFPDYKSARAKWLSLL